MRLDELDRSVVYSATVRKNTRITPEDYATDVRELVLDVDGKDFWPTVGQSIGILVEGDPDFGKPEHFRLYSVADTAERSSPQSTRIKICVRRCDYIDAFSGEKYHGRASHYLCDSAVGDSLRVTARTVKCSKCPMRPMRG